MIGLIKKLQDKGQAKQDQTDALVNYIQDEMTADAMQQVGQALAPVIAPTMATTMPPVQTFAPVSQSDVSVLEKLMKKSGKNPSKTGEPSMNLPFYPKDIDLEKVQQNLPFNLLQGQNTSPLDYIQKLPMRKFDNFAPVSQKAMDMMNKKQTMNPTILKARGM